MKKKVIFTVDVEGHVGKDPVASLIYGKTKDGKLCGIDLIMDMLDEFGVVGLFFVDIAEAWDYGEEKIAGVLKHIKERGHTVGVHIHPDHMADKKRLFLAEYSYCEQYDIIKKCTDFYERVLGEKPLAFRAGKYGANWDTLNILAKLGYKADFSQFYGQKWCKIDPPATYIKTKKLVNGITEVPVTSFVSFSSAIYSRFDKLDVGNMIGEFKAVINKLLMREDCEVIVMFAHSFSLINWRRVPNAPVFSKTGSKRMLKQLQFVLQTEQLQIVDLSALICQSDIEEVVNNNQMDFVVMRDLKTVIYFMDRAWGVVKAKVAVNAREWHHYFSAYYKILSSFIEKM